MATGIGGDGRFVLQAVSGGQTVYTVVTEVASTTRLRVAPALSFVVRAALQGRVPYPSSTGIKNLLSARWYCCADSGVLSRPLLRALLVGLIGCSVFKTVVSTASTSRLVLVTGAHMRVSYEFRV